MKFAAALLVAISVMGSLRVNDPVIDVAQFIVGFFDAMGVDVTVSGITGCVKNAEAIYGELLNVINELKTLDLKNFVKIIGAVEDIIKIVQDILGDIRTCSAIPADAQAIVSKIMNFDISKRTFVIISHFGKIVSDITSLISLVQKTPIDTYELGLTIGDILDIVIIADSESSVSTGIANDFAKGFFKACGVDVDITLIDACLGDNDGMYEDLAKLVTDIKGVDLKNLNVIVKVLQDITKFVNDFLASIKPCASSIPEIGELIKKMIIFNPAQRIYGILWNLQFLISDIMYIPIDFYNGNFEKLGHDIGSIVYVFLLE
jgi:hypothetical protein